MLVITCKVGESFRVGDHVRVVVTGFKGREVKLAIFVPRHIVVDREEIAERKRLRVPRSADFKTA